jgi:hypothetical protein
MALRWPGKTTSNYSNKNFNTFTTAAHRQHTVLLKDEVRELLLLGMEDTSRPGGDNDFNDAVFYVTANPYTALITENLATTKTSTESDRDRDGIPDRNDEFPDDPERAFTVYFPAKGQLATLAFEDMWPRQGDYDMNDLVMDYQFRMVTNASNRVVDLNADFYPSAVGASFRNGFGLALPVTNSQVKAVDWPQKAALRQVRTDGKGLEEGHNTAVAVLFEDALALIGSDRHANTFLNQPFLPSVHIPSLSACNFNPLC